MEQLLLQSRWDFPDRVDDRLTAYTAVTFATRMAQKR